MPPPPPFTWLYNVHSSVVNSTPYLIKKSHALYVSFAPTQATQGEPTFHGFPWKMCQTIYMYWEIKKQKVCVAKSP